MLWQKGDTAAVGGGGGGVFLEVDDIKIPIPTTMSGVEMPLGPLEVDTELCCCFSDITGASLGVETYGGVGVDNMCTYLENWELGVLPTVQLRMRGSGGPSVYSADELKIPDGALKMLCVRVLLKRESGVMETSGAVLHVDLLFRMGGLCVYPLLPAVQVGRELPAVPVSISFYVDSEHHTFRHVSVFLGFPPHDGEIGGSDELDAMALQPLVVPSDFPPFPVVAPLPLSLQPFMPMPALTLCP